MKVRDLTLAALLTAVISVVAPFTVPVGPVPLTLQTFIIPLVAMIATPRISFWATLGYLLVGLIGLPVFAGGKSGLGVFVGPTGGYLLSLLVFPLILGWYQTHLAINWRNSIVMNVIAAVVQLGLGAVWLMFAAHLAPQTAFTAGFGIFLLPLLIKVILVVLCTQGIQRSVRLPLGALHQ